MPSPYFLSLCDGAHTLDGSPALPAVPKYENSGWLIHCELLSQLGDFLHQQTRVRQLLGKVYLILFSVLSGLHFNPFHPTCYLRCLKVSTCRIQIYILLCSLSLPPSFSAFQSLPTYIVF